MTRDEYADLQAIITAPKPWEARLRLSEYLKTVTVSETPVHAPQPSTDDLRTSKQSDSLFLWFSMIEKEAENAGVTWDRIIKHTHQLRVTKENLHSMCKQLTKALWGINSTKKIKKREHLDIIIDHYVDLFAKEGLTLPPFPEENGMRLTVMDNLHELDYPEYTSAPTI